MSARHLPAWLALLAYLVTVSLGGCLLRRERMARHRLQRREVMRKIQDFEAEQIVRDLKPALDLIGRVKGTEPRRPALHLVRGGAR